MANGEDSGAATRGYDGPDGKLVWQYDPNQVPAKAGSGAGQQAMSRLYMAGVLVEGSERTWTASDDQKIEGLD